MSRLTIVRDLLALVDAVVTVGVEFLGGDDGSEVWKQEVGEEVSPGNSNEGGKKREEERDATNLRNAMLAAGRTAS